MRRVAALLACVIVGAGWAAPARAASVSIDIPDAYATVKGGERVYFQVEFLYPENPRRRDFRISYQVREGEDVIASAQFLKAVETQASFSDYAVIPETAKPGIHSITVDIIDDTGATIVQGASTSFEVQPTFDWAAAHFYMILAAIFSIGIVLSFEIHGVRRLVRRA